MATHKIIEIQFQKPTSFPGAANPRAEMHLSKLRPGSSMVYVPELLTVFVTTIDSTGRKRTDGYPTSGLVRYRFETPPEFKATPEKAEKAPTAAAKS